MKKATLLIALILPLLLQAQVNLKTICKTSHQVFAYKVNATTAEKYILKDTIDVDAYLYHQPDAIFPIDSVDENKLPTGNYVLISIRDNNINARVISVSNLLAYPINNERRLQLLVRDKEGNFIDDATIWINNKPAPYNKIARSYWVKQKNADDAFVKVCAPGDTTFLSLSLDNYSNRSVWRQRWDNAKRTNVVRTLMWLHTSIETLFKKHYPSANERIGAKGTMVFNQPKYKLTDTVKLKAYIFDKRWNRYNKPARVFLSYYVDHEGRHQLLKILTPSAPGSYVFEFPLSDTLKNDTRYTIEFKTADGKLIISKTFSVEDYVIDEMAKYNFHSSKETYYSNDTMHFFASASDANGLPVLDAETELMLTTDDVNGFYTDSMYVPDTLVIQKKKLLTGGETKFDIPVNKFPNASLSIKATTIFKNSNNELHEQTTDIVYNPQSHQFHAGQNADTVYADYKVNGVNVRADGIVKMEGINTLSKEIHFPYKVKIDPLAKNYQFFVMTNNAIYDSCTAEIEDSYNITLTRISSEDTLGFVLNNKYEILVSFSVFDGSRQIGAGMGSGDTVRWLYAKPNKHRVYTVRWMYMWHGQEEKREQEIVLLYKLLQIKINEAANVFPGQKDTIKIDVRDYKGKPASSVNLTAVSYNSQLSKDINVPDPPYLVRYRRRPFIERGKYDIDDNYADKDYSLGKHKGWIKKMGLDSMLYYKMLFPKDSVFDAVSHIEGYLAQASVNVVQKGERQEIYMLYINRELVYYNGVTDRMPYAFRTYGGYIQIGIRLLNKFIEIDSIYTQPSYKHDLVFDLGHLPVKSTITSMPVWLTADEKKRLNNSLWQLDNNYVTNNGYVWQNEMAVKLSGNRKHIVGPFATNDSMHFFAPKKFDIHFRFEDGYEYNLSKKILRLEKKNVFANDAARVFLPVTKNPEWILGDTILPPPVIAYDATRHENHPYIEYSNYNEYTYGRKAYDKSSVHLAVPKDTILDYIILHNNTLHQSNIILHGYLRNIVNLQPGNYTLYLVTQDFRAAEKDNIIVKMDSALCLNTGSLVYYEGDTILSRLITTLTPEKAPVPANKQVITFDSLDVALGRILDYTEGAEKISGIVVDKKGGNPIPFATISIKGTKKTVVCDVDGTFTIRGVHAGLRTVVASAIGYISTEVTVEINKDTQVKLTIPMAHSSSALGEVVVTTALGIQRSTKMLGYATMSRGEELTSVIQGKVSGLEVNLQSEEHSPQRITLRGDRSIGVDEKLLIVVDGIIYSGDLGSISPDIISDVEVLKDASATAIYGARAANGVIVITTKAKTFRTQFRDYAFWQPQLFTDEKGQAQFVVTYPDNVTSWETFVLGMDKHRRMGKAVSIVKSFKPVMAQLSMPQFLLEGDTTELVAKAMNYTTDTYHAATTFSVNGKADNIGNVELIPKASQIQSYKVLAPVGDTLKASFSLQTTTGFKDGEQRKIPVFKKGTEESTGKFWVLKGDTTVQFVANENNQSIEVYAQNNTLDILLNEIEYLKKYPFYCMEQTSSKLKGLLMEKKIDELLHKPFTGGEIIGQLLQRLQSAQLFEGGWGWWQNSKPDLFMTNYVIRALLLVRENPMVEINIRNGLLYLQNQLTKLNEYQLLHCLLTMSEAHHTIDYQPWLQKISFDSLDVTEQWEYVRIKQLLNLGHGPELDTLMKQAIPGMLGSLHWGEINYRWYGDADATTTLAFDVLQHEDNRSNELNSIVQYFLQQRGRGHWENTAKSASIVSTILPYIASVESGFNKPAKLSVTGDTSFTVETYPFAAIMHGNIKNLNITKTGGGLTYVTAYQNFFNTQPQPVTKDFAVSTAFYKNGSPLIRLTAGEKTTMVITINTLRDAEYVMIEAPIPAGCTYASKDNIGWDMHTEYFKNKIVMFTEYLSQGQHTFEIQLEARYNGAYTLNPAKASLMYYPTFFGRNEMKKVKIEEGISGN